MNIDNFKKSRKGRNVLNILKIIAAVLPVIIIFILISGIGSGKTVTESKPTESITSSLKEVSRGSSGRESNNTAQTNTLATSTIDSVTKETQDSRYLVTDGQEAISSLPSKTYTGGTELDDFFYDAVFVGDSITVGWSNYVYSKGNGFFGNPYFLAKVGYAASTALSPYYNHPMYNGVRDYVYNSIAKMNVSKVFISFGLNDAISTPQVVIGYYERLINLILRYSPQVKIYVISTTYVCKGSEQGYVTSDNVRAYNRLVKQFCELNGYTYVDVASYLATTEGYLPRTYSSDGYVHLNASAYSVWETVLRNLAQTEINAAKGRETTVDELEDLPDPLKETGYSGGGYTTSATLGTSGTTASQTETNSSAGTSSATEKDTFDSEPTQKVTDKTDNTTESSSAQSQVTEPSEETTESPTVVSSEKASEN